MQDYLNLTPDNEIDLRELFISLWAHKLLITSSCVLGILIGLYYVQHAEKKFIASATFRLEPDEQMNFSFSKKDIGPLASIAGLSGAGRKSNLPLDQIAGRVFIQKLDAELNFKADPYFNTYSPKSDDPVWKSLIKRAIGWQKPSTDTQTNALEAIWQGIVIEYSKNVQLVETKQGSAKVLVTHTNPQRAADIANGIMNIIISTESIKKISKQDQQLSYLSNTLAKALSDLEVAQNNLKVFTLENSALPLESFTAESLALDALREQLKRSTKLHEAVVALSLMQQNKTTNQDDYLKLRRQFPIVDKVEFRRVLGQSEIISFWSWPKASSVNAVFDTLSERITRLQSNINELQINADRSGIALEIYSKLERESKIAEATYTVLIEQVKAQSIAAGYNPDSNEVYEYASAPINSSTPILLNILLLGAALGLFVGIVLSCILAHLRGVYYSRKSLKFGAQARLTFSVRSLLHLRNKSLNELNTMVIKKPNSILRDMAVAIHKSGATQIVVTSSRSKLSGDDATRALASYMQSDTMKVAVINFSLRAKKLDINYESLPVGSFVVAERKEHVSVLRPEGNLASVEQIAQKGFRESIQELNSIFDLVFLSADDGIAISLLSALDEKNAFHITLARIRKTKSVTFTQMRSHLPIQGLLHD